MKQEEREKIINQLWEISSHGTDRISIENAFNAGRESMQKEAAMKCVWVNENFNEHPEMAIICHDVIMGLKIGD